MSKSKEKKAGARPWRDNIEAVTVSIVTIVLFKYFVLEAYKIPTGSMQPTLMGNAETGIFDRVLVDKCSYHFRDPVRFEVVVFKYPLNRAQNFIKRIIGMPGEELEIRDGDLFRRDLDEDGRGSGDWQVLRRPRTIEDEQLRRLDLTKDWQFQGQGWVRDGDDIVGTGPGRAEFPPPSRNPLELPSIRDGYTDGYPRSLVAKIETRNKGSNANEVSDLRVTTTVRADAGTKEVRLVLREGKRRFRFLLPGPAAADDARPTIEASDPDGGMSRITAVASEPWRLSAGASIDVLAQNLDDLLTLELEGRPPLTLEVPPAGEQRASGIALETEGGGARFDDVELFRDIFYTVQGQKVTRWTIPAGSYVMLGDNPQDSSDGRDWRLTGIKVIAGPDAGEVVRGNHRERENPRWVGGQADGGTMFIRDELGELRWYPDSDFEMLPVVAAPLVGREAIVGRAVLVVWPLSPKQGVYRVKWVR
jgi:signal peptidase I